MAVPTPEKIQYMLARVHETKVPQLISSTVIILVFSTASVALRFFARHTSKAKLRLSDWFILLALILLHVFSIAVWITIPLGGGRHSILVTNAKDVTIWMLVTAITITIAISAVKASLLCFYVQLFPQLWIRRTSICIGAIVLAYTIAHIVSDVLQCIPLSALWDPTITDAICYSFNDQVTAMGTINIATDIIILVLPMPPIWGLMISRSRKWQLSLILSLGGFACIASLVRVIYVRKIDPTDSTWDGVEACELSALEVGLGIIAACLPTCRTLFSRIFNTSLGMRYFYSKPRDINVIVTGDNGSHELADDKSKAKSSTSQHSFQSVVEDEERLCGISAPRQK